MSAKPKPILTIHTEHGGVSNLDRIMATAAAAYQIKTPANQQCCCCGHASRNHLSGWGDVDDARMGRMCVVPGCSCMSFALARTNDTLPLIGGGAR